MSALLHHAWTIMAKDLRIEMRTKETLLTMGYFGFLVILIFTFNFWRGDAPISGVAAGILWVSIAFSGTLGLGRAFDREREGDCLRAVLLTPIPRAALYLGKTAGIIIFMLIIEGVVIPAVAFFFNLSLNLRQLASLLEVVLLGTIGYSVVGTLLAAMLVKVRSKDVLLAVVLYPLILPVLISGVKATSALFETNAQYEELEIWVPVLIFYDITFLIASLWIFESMLED